MQKRTKRFLLLLLFVFACFLLSGCQTNKGNEMTEDSNQKMQEAQQKIQELETRLEELMKENETLQDQIAMLNQENTMLKATAGRVAELEKLITDLNKMIQDYEQRVVEMITENGHLVETIKNLNEALLKTQNQLLQDVSSLEAQIDVMVLENEKLKNQVKELTEKSKAEEERLAKTYEALTDNLSQRLSSKEVEIDYYKNILRLSIASRIFFDSGKAELKPEGKELLAKVVPFLKSLPDKIVRVEGHTDNKPILPSLQSKYATNWELSSARAVVVVRFLQEEQGMDPFRLSAAGLGEYRPKASNDTEEGRQENRRIEIVIIDRAVYQLMEMQNALQNGNGN